MMGGMWITGAVSDFMDIQFRWRRCRQCRGATDDAPADLIRRNTPSDGRQLRKRAARNSLGFFAIGTNAGSQARSRQPGEGGPVYSTSGCNADANDILYVWPTQPSLGLERIRTVPRLPTTNAIHPTGRPRREIKRF